MRRRACSTLPWVLLATVLGIGGSAGAQPPRVYASPEAVQPLAAGDRVPQAELHDVHGEPVTLRSLVEERGALLVFYRGGW